MDYLSRFTEYLQEKRLPLTRQRERIVRTALLVDDHFSAENLADALKQRGIRVGRATVYRTLALMVSCGLIREHNFGSGFKTYEKVVDRRHHDHLICEVCGRVTEFEAPDIERLQKEVIDRHHFRARSHKLEIYGLCRDCSG